MQLKHSLVHSSQRLAVLAQLRQRNSYGSILPTFNLRMLKDSTSGDIVYNNYDDADLR